MTTHGNLFGEQHVSARNAMDRPGPSVFLYHATLDDDAPFEQRAPYRAALDAAGDLDALFLTHGHITGLFADGAIRVDAALSSLNHFLR
ncbi:hypothetical protein [Sinimarinibacterium thermocellulolyticum]|uniref:Uncharacterized protein n=1 Tax=Sinimarinibacterium thermocellulolyticum TaxID=3170016 RepID=A0ABV2A944_9GAMM